MGWLAFCDVLEGCGMSNYANSPFANYWHTYFPFPLKSILLNLFEELTHLKRPWCWERLKAGGEGDDRGWDGWMASLTWGTWVWVDSGSWWRTGRPGVLRFMGSQRVRHDWATELNWTELTYMMWHCGLHLEFCGYRWWLRLDPPGGEIT